MNDAFERSIQKTLDGFEVPYNSADWAQMEHALNGSRPASWWGSPVLYGALLAGALAVGSAGYLLLRSDGPTAELKGSRTAELSSTGLDPAQQLTAEGTSRLTSPGGSESTSTLPMTAAADPAGQTSTDRTTRTTGDLRPASSTSTNPALKSVTFKEANEPHHTGSSVPKAAAFVASLSEGCEGSAVEFSVNNMPENGIYLWNFGDGSFSNKPNPSHTFNKPGKFTVTLSMSSPGVGTIRNEPYADLIVIHEVPEASFNAVRLEYSGHVPSVHFENRSHGGAKYHWDFGDGSTSAIAHPDHVYREKGIYKVTLRVSNETGCEDMMEKEVRIENDYNLLAPAAFSPNGDGQDDHFMPQALKDLGVKFHLSIFEPKTGRLVYETSDASKPWTGRQANTGALCARGQYVWMVEIQESLPIGEITYEGKVSLVD